MGHEDISKHMHRLCYHIATFDTVGFLPLQTLVDRVEVYTGYIEQYLKQPNIPRFHKVVRKYMI